MMKRFKHCVSQTQMKMEKDKPLWSHRYPHCYHYPNRWIYPSIWLQQPTWFLRLSEGCGSGIAQTEKKSEKNIKINVSAILTVRPSLYLASNTDMAAREPEPIVANGRVSVEPWGYIWISTKALEMNSKRKNLD